jgi:hypothetical protein
MKALFLLCALAFALNVHGQWTTDTSLNTLVADSEGGDMKATGTSGGATYVVFWKVVAAPANYELRMQVLDVDGNQTLGPDGMLVSNTIPMSTFTVIWNITTDENDNIYIGVTGTGAGNPAYVFKLDSNGSHLWPSGGVNVGSGFVPTILPLSSGEAVVTWAPGGESLMQKYNSAGVAVWGSPQPVVNAGNDTSPGDIFELSNGDYLMVFHSLTGGISSNLFAQRYDDAGLPQWGTPTQLSNQATAFNRSYGGVQEGDVVFYGYFGSTGVRFDSFLQRINGDGSLPWGINGSDFDTGQSFYEMDTRIAFAPGSQYVWELSTYTNNSQSERGEYVQKFDKTSGARQFSDMAKMVYAVGSENVHAGALHLKGDSPLFLLKSGIDNGVTPTTLGVVYLDNSGNFVWPEESRAVATFSANKSRIHYTKPVNNQSVAVFIEQKTSEPKIYAQNFLDEQLDVRDYAVDTSVVFTNPVIDTLTIESRDGITNIVVFTLLGQIFFSETYNETFRLDMVTESWPSGLYVIQLTTDSGFQKNFKVLKQ